MKLYKVINYISHNLEIMKQIRIGNKMGPLSRRVEYIFQMVSFEHTVVPSKGVFLFSKNRRLGGGDVVA